jgi:ribosome-interacting GTPase 1
MPINAGYEYSVAIQEYDKAKTPKDKLKALQKVLAASPNHKGSERLRSGIKQKIAKLREEIENQGKKKGGGKSLSIKKEGAAQVCLIGTTQSGKSVFLNKITNVKAKVGAHPFTTKSPEIGTLDYKGIKIQVIEIPAVTRDFIMQEKGGIYLGIIKQCNLLVLFGKNKEEINLVLSEMNENDVKKPIIVYNENENMIEKIWDKLGLIKVYTKQPGKEKDFPPMAFKKISTVKSLAEVLHKDFVKKFKFARIWGKGTKFDGMQVGLNYKLHDENIVEIHTK